MRIVVTSLRGGVGMSTTSICLSAVAVERGYDPVTLIDADPRIRNSSALITRQTQTGSSLQCKVALRSRPALGPSDLAEPNGSRGTSVYRHGRGRAF